MNAFLRNSRFCTDIFTSRGYPISQSLCSALTLFEQGGTFIVPHLTRHVLDLVKYALIRKTVPLVLSYYQPGVLRTYSNPDTHGLTSNIVTYNVNVSSSGQHIVIAFDRSVTHRTFQYRIVRNNFFLNYYILIFGYR